MPECLCQWPACCRHTVQMRRRKLCHLLCAFSLSRSVPAALQTTAGHLPAFNLPDRSITTRCHVILLDALSISYTSSAIVPAGVPAGCKGAHPAGHHDPVHLRCYCGGDVPPQRLPSGSRAAHAHHHAGHLVHPGGPHPVQRWAHSWMQHGVGCSIHVCAPKAQAYIPDKAGKGRQCLLHTLGACSPSL